MTTFRPTTFLRRVLAIDAVTCAAAGLLMTCAAGALEQPLHLPADLLFYAGVVLVPFAALLVFLATRETLPRAAVWAVILGNAGWVLVSLLVLTTPLRPTPLGYGFVIAQAAATALLAELEYTGLRRATGQTPTTAA
jgi:hypothetical protein